MDSKQRDPEIELPDRPIRQGHVGLVVAGPMITGFVDGFVLVIGPFAGTQEHVVMGIALLGWALFALLSMRSTNKPRRGAAEVNE